MKWISTYSRRVSYIDDGMDTFREKPHNIDISLVQRAHNYFTFAYPLPVANWVKSLNVVEVCPIELLAETELPCYSTTESTFLVIESPGLPADLTSVIGHSPAVYFVHPNPAKRRTFSLSGTNVSGMTYSLEKTISAHSGPIVVGESMAMIYGLCVMPRLQNIHVYLDPLQKSNLECIKGKLMMCRSSGIREA